jgi:predicted PurR-regulated permease PerM
LRSELHAQRLLVVLLLLATGLVALLASPFWGALLMAAVFAAALRPLMERLARALRGRRHLAALALTLGVLLAVLLPVGALGAALVKEVLRGVLWLKATLASQGIWGLVERLPDPVAELVRRLVAAIPDPQAQLQQLAARGGQAAVALGGVLAATGTIVFQATLFLIALFFFLTDGARLVGWIDGHLPLRPGQFRTLMDEFRRTSASVLLATVATAGIQTVTALAGYLIAGAPSVLFLTLITFVVALIPALGAAVVLVAVGLLLMATGHVFAGVFLAVWGVVVVSIIDNVARPFLLKGGLSLHGGLVFFALLGGLAVFGAVGLVIGPLALTFLATAADMYRRELEAEPSAPGGGRDSRAASPPARAGPPGERQGADGGAATP